MLQHRGGDPLGERFEERDVLLRYNDPDAISDHVIRKHVSHIFYQMCPATDLYFDIKTNILRLLAFARVSPDASGYHEIADEDVVGRGVTAAWIDRISTRREQSIIDSHRVKGVLGATGLERDERANEPDGLRIDAGGPIAADAKRAAEAKIVRRH